MTHDLKALADHTKSMINILEDYANANVTEVAAQLKSCSLHRTELEQTLDIAVGLLAEANEVSVEDAYRVVSGAWERKWGRAT